MTPESGKVGPCKYLQGKYWSVTTNVRRITYAVTSIQGIKNCELKYETRGLKLTYSQAPKQNWPVIKIYSINCQFCRILVQVLKTNSNSLRSALVRVLVYRLAQAAPHAQNAFCPLQFTKTDFSSTWVLFLWSSMRKNRKNNRKTKRVWRRCWPCQSNLPYWCSHLLGKQVLYFRCENRYCWRFQENVFTHVRLVTCTTIAVGKCFVDDFGYILIIQMNCLSWLSWSSGVPVNFTSKQKAKYPYCSFQEVIPMNVSSTKKELSKLNGVLLTAVYFEFVIRMSLSPNSRLLNEWLRVHVVTYSAIMSP